YTLSRAYLKVQDGCSGRCSYCIVPSFRGKPTSIPFHTVLGRARAFLAAGFREIILAGCNLCLYKSEGRGIAELAAALAALESPGHRIRFGSIEPGMCDDSILDAMEGAANICRFLHLSLQSGSDRILKLMRRPYTSGQVLSFCAEACRRLGPRLALGADIIAGFPGESDSDHEATKRFVSMNMHMADDAFRRPAQEAALSPFIHLHVFPYSERPGTEAATMAGSIPAEVRRRRAKEIESIGLRNRLGFASRLVGKTVAVCAERGGCGRTDEHLRCILHGKAERKSIVRATVENYSPKDGSLSAIILAKDELGGIRMDSAPDTTKGGAQS
ncbi:MAG: radical SAM protein, partial [Verrucomicrobiota bacterium]|nr:radical SAM protein [Verrucomicrobiota bacterium]